MSAIEQHPSERRRSTRTRLRCVLRALIARHEAIVVDVSLHGARVRHENAVRRGATVRVVFEWEQRRFAAAAEVLATRIVTLGAGDDEPAIYESRLRFPSLTADALDILHRVIAAAGNHELRSWVGNLQGDAGDARGTHPSPTRGFIRCRYVHRRWERKWTRDASQPHDGFVIPAATDSSDIAALCSSWESMDDASRNLVQLTARAVVEGMEPMRGYNDGKA